MATNYRIPTEFKPLFWWTDQTTPPYRYYDFSGGRSSGKSTTVALALTLEAGQYPIRVLCAREFQNSIKDSVKKLLDDTIDALQLPGFHSTIDSITHANGSEFIFKGLHDTTAQSIKSMEGIDRCWIEEAQTITERSLDILLPTIRKTGSTVIFTRNPLTPEDVITNRFVSHPTDETAARTYHKHVNWQALDRLGILPDEIRHQINEARNTPEYAHIWEGQPYAHIINQIIDWQQLDAATHTTTPTGGITFGIDVARYGIDRTALAINHGGRLEKLDCWQHASITETADRITTLAAVLNPARINVDDTGVGGGLTDILASHGLPVSGVNYAARAKRPDLYPNTASELWFEFAQRLADGTITINPELEHRAELFTELTTREWKINARNQRVVQPKADFKAENGTRSPDLADAVLLAFYQPPKLPSWNVVC